MYAYIYMYVYMYIYIHIHIYIYMSAPSNTQHKTSHFSNPSVAVGPPVSTAFPRQTE